MLWGHERDLIDARSGADFKFAMALGNTTGHCAMGYSATMDPILTSTEYRLLVEHSPVMIWRSGTDAKCDYFNEGWLAFTGRSIEQEMGDGWAEGVHPEDLEGCVAHYLDHFHRRAPFEMEYRLRRHDGVYRWIFDRGVPFRDSTGNFAGYVGSCVDVDERRKAQDAQKQYSEAQLAQARDFEKWILAIVSHDIRNPLNTINFAAQLLGKVPDPSGTVKQNADIVTRSVRRIQNIVGDLLDLSRERQAGGIPIEPKPTNLQILCEQIIADFELTEQTREIHFSCEIDSTGFWDAARIMQAVSNLLSNAMQHGTPNTPISVSLAGDEGQIAIEVENQGSIPQGLLPNLFVPFGSARSHAKRSDGLGLGLFIAQAIARAHGGGLEVDSSEGTTRCRITLPRQVENLTLPRASLATNRSELRI